MISVLFNGVETGRDLLGEGVENALGHSENLFLLEASGDEL